MEQGQEPESRPTGQEPSRGHRYRSFFWAIVLIGVGVVWLLFNLDVISPANLGMLSLVWPILVVGFGVDLLVGRRSLKLGALVGVVTVGLIIVFMLLGPAFGWVGDTDLKTQTFSTPVGQATGAQVTVSTSGYSAKVHALQSSFEPERPLMTASVSYRGSVEFESSGELEKTVSIKASGQRWWWHWLDVVDAEPWDIGLDPGLPLSLNVESASGSSNLDLSGLRLTDLGVNVSSGSVEVLLPALSAYRYKSALHLSSGEMKVRVPDRARIDMSIGMSSGDVRVALGQDSDVTLSFEGSSGEFTLDLAAGQAFQVEVREVSSGGVDLPSGLVQVTKGDGKEGTWETQGYAAASHKVRLIIEHVSSGSVNINQ